jgi:hypothetical protein
MAAYLEKRPAPWLVTRDAERDAPPERGHP